MRSLVVFEDLRISAFSILTPLRAVFDLRCGARTLLERQVAALQPDRVVLLPRPEMHDLVRETHPQYAVGAARLAAADAGNVDSWFVNGRLLALGQDVPRMLANLASGQALVAGDALVVARCSGEAAVRLAEGLQAEIALAAHDVRAAHADAGWRSPIPDLAVRDVRHETTAWAEGSRLLDHAWELVTATPRALHDDARLWDATADEDSVGVHPSATLLHAAQVFLGPRVEIGPGVVLDARDGPILIGEGTRVQPLCMLQGPLSLGPHCLIKAGARLHEDTSLGPFCKVGGEVEACVLQGYSNKQHDGFLGHAFLGEWNNLGADTNNSDLKNNYSNVRVWESGRSVDTGELFVGLIAGDHVKSAINTAFNTGTVVGLASQIFGAGFPPKYVPPFTWGGIASRVPYDVDKAVATARIVMERRDRAMTSAYEAAFRRAWERSRHDAPSD